MADSCEPLDAVGDGHPVFLYDDVEATVDWLWDAFGFEQRLRIGDNGAVPRVTPARVRKARAVDLGAEPSALFGTCGMA
jgi:hypothetical protein